MLIASLVEFAFAKQRMRQEHNAQLVNLDIASLLLTGQGPIRSPVFIVATRRICPAP